MGTVLGSTVLCATQGRGKLREALAVLVKCSLKFRKMKRAMEMAGHRCSSQQHRQTEASVLFSRAPRQELQGQDSELWWKVQPPWQMEFRERGSRVSPSGGGMREDVAWCTNYMEAEGRLNSSDAILDTVF